MFGSVDNYEVFEITIKKIEKKKWSFKELEEKDAKIMENIKSVLEGKGLVYALGRKVNKEKVIKGIYIFNYEEKDGEKLLIFDKKMFVEEIPEKDITEFEEALDSHLGSLVAVGQFNRAIFGEKEYEIKKVKIGKYQIAVSLLWILWGFVTSVLTEDIMWLCFGVVFATTFSYVVKVNGTQIAAKELKREKKKKEKSKKKNSYVL